MSKFPYEFQFRDFPASHVDTFSPKICEALSQEESSWVQKNLTAEILQGGAPPSSNFVISPLTIDIAPINHSYWSYKPT
jgi:hypothetical protein